MRKFKRYYRKHGKQNLRTSFKITQKTNAAATNQITRQKALSKILSP
ncbi:hypothetical protein CSUNSWCD_1041 [Campylobacter showae CSUNSWCD]|uniref:Uncharacterized protein n=1 Tax=Campylobacter showae CSUNSWCD TaxID=1244083 RepID=M5IND7_9BACT|nr:hypothetical protein CSUNSWCD_1041 [Campylobacter showae CSUNSWCD]